ncbi:MAG: hypothetical protein BHW39_11955 [Firmicutes bacterium CAG:552_39_19]|jgi:hypothetical protein|nr:MAG: hypothetical protein BHW39_11955 [Firmicutes bacterium CAG:552_39_19]DAJ14734.1 MAG TPA: hypothetical protein [Myoviridae sp. ctNhr24]DAT31232.1 MAG TPA: hypothetical protein [Caudoviricetes sp.]
MRLLAIYKRLEPSADNQNKTLPVPRYITIMQKCVEHKIQDVFIRNSHFNDLYVLIMSIDIANLKQMIRQMRAAKAKETNTTVRDVSQSDAVKFLKGGSANGGKY